VKIKVVQTQIASPPGKADRNDGRGERLLLHLGRRIAMTGKRGEIASVEAPSQRRIILRGVTTFEWTKI